MLVWSNDLMDGRVYHVARGGEVVDDSYITHVGVEVRLFVKLDA